MITGAGRAGFEETILSCCKALFLTSAIPDLIRQEGTPRQIEYLAAALRKRSTAGKRTNATVWSSGRGSRSSRPLKAMSTAA